MEQMPQHREGIQNELDKAYDEGHRENALNESQAINNEERGHMEDKEIRGELSLEETVALLKDKGYLDTSFEGKETHQITIRSISREEAIEAFRSWGDGSQIDEKIPYSTPEDKIINVMIVRFHKELGTEEIISEINKLGVRPLTSEELLQCVRIQDPEQRPDPIIAIGNNFPHLAIQQPGISNLFFAGLYFDRGEVDFTSVVDRKLWDGWYGFAVTPK